MKARTRDPILRRGPLLALALGAIVGLLACGRTAPAPPPRPDIVVFLVDTLRADHLGCYGYAKPVSPHIDAFAADATLFLDGRAQASWTRPAIGALLTGLYPVSIPIWHVDDSIPEGVETLAERLFALGYSTEMITTNDLVSRRFGFGQGFERFHYLRKRGSEALFLIPAFQPTELAARWIRARDPGRPLFLVVHVADPHAPYAPLDPYRRAFAPAADPRLGSLDTLRAIDTGARPLGPTDLESIIALYDAEIAETDAAFGEFLAALRATGIYDRALVLFVADHGEEFLEHGHLQHGRTLFEDQLRVPFILRLPGGRGARRRLDAVADQVDFVPTVLDLLRLPPDPELPGQSLLPLVSGTATPAARSSLAFVDTRGTRWQSAVKAGWKLVAIRAPGASHATRRLFDLLHDPRELSDLGAARPESSDALLADLRSARAHYPPRHPGQTSPLSDATMAQLRALGYIQ